MATEVVIPMLGVTVEKGKILEWLKKEGDRVEKGESIYVVEADKVTTEVESPATGILAKILLPVDQEVPVLTVVAVITAEGEEVPEQYLKPTTPTTAVATPAPTPAAAPATTTAAPAVATAPAQSDLLKIVPAARKLAAERGIDPLTIAGSGPDGVILYADIEKATAAKASPLAARMAAQQGVDLAYVEGSGVRGRIMQADVRRAAAQAAAPGLGKVLPLNSMRKVIARRMAQSAFSAPHIYFFTDICMDPLLNFVRQIKSEFEETFGVRPSVNDFLIKAVALNILKFPMLNACLQEEEICILADVNISLAVALDDGLIVPAIANADTAGMADIVRQRIDLVKRARSGNLSLEELDRGTFTISSLAQYDITAFTAIINPPQSGILSLGKTREELYMDENTVKTRRIATFGLSVDHRIIDGVVAADFLQNLKAKLEKPAFTFLNC